MVSEMTLIPTPFSTPLLSSITFRRPLLLPSRIASIEERPTDIPYGDDAVGSASHDVMTASECRGIDRHAVGDVVMTDVVLFATKMADAGVIFGVGVYGRSGRPFGGSDGLGEGLHGRLLH